MIRSEVLIGGSVVWSLWDGYLQGAAGDRLQATLTAADVPLIQLHTSGHASPTDLRRLVDAVRPRVVVPIHTDSPDAYGSTFDGAVALHPDGQWWAAKHPVNRTERPGEPLGGRRNVRRTRHLMNAQPLNLGVSTPPPRYPCNLPRNLRGESSLVAPGYTG